MTPLLALLLTPALAETPVGVGMDPNQIVSNVAGAAGATTQGPRTAEFKPYFNGFIKAPLTLGLGRKGTLHAPPRVPDKDYLDWRFTNNPGGPWAELKMQYANEHVSANLAIATYSPSDAGYNNPAAQLGITNAFVTFNYPDLFGDKGGMVAHIGSFTNRYGASGRWGAGMYETYLLGATHVEGENIRTFHPIADKWMLHLEQGFGAKLEVTPQVAIDAPYLPYGGPQQQGDTLLHHEHIGVSYDNKLTAAAHYLTEWTDDAEKGEKDGRITSMGADLRLVDSKFGDGYLGYSRVVSRDNWRVASALEVLHSGAGWNLSENYFGDLGSGTGNIDTFLFQYTFSTARFLWHPEPFWGQEKDLTFTPFLMTNHITSDDPDARGAANKLKAGAFVTYTPAKWFGMGARFDSVNPDLADSSTSFQVFSPRLVFRSDYASNEQVIVQYNAYFYGDNVTPAWPDIDDRPDRHLLSIQGVIWW